MENEIQELESRLTPEKVNELKALYVSDPAQYLENLRSAAFAMPVEPPKAKPIGGWLILLSLGLIYNPLMVLKTIFKDLLPVLKPEMIQVMTTPGTEYYNPALLNLVYVEVAYNIAMLIAAIYLIVVFFRKQKAFIIAFIIVYLTNLVFVALDTFLAHIFQQGSTVYASEISYLEIIKQIVVCSIWVPYLTYSKRAKETFIKD